MVKLNLFFIDPLMNSEPSGTSRILLLEPVEPYVDFAAPFKEHYVVLYSLVSYPFSFSTEWHSAAI